MRKLRVGIIFGGRSGEHEVSLMSAQSIMQAIDRDKYEVVPIGITREGHWIASGDPLRALIEGKPQLASPAALLPQPGAPALVPSATGAASHDTPAPGRGTPRVLADIDVFFPVLHGPYGEDGTIQGLLELAGVPYVGAGVAASAVGMDKALMKALFRQAGLPVLDYLVVTAAQWERDPQAVRAKVGDEIGFPCFVKPANLGSSVGVSRVAGPAQLDDAIALALRYDLKVLVERAAEDCREVEVSVLGNDFPEASVPGEIVPAAEFYDYRAKYLDDRSELVIPARISPGAANRVRAMALDAFRAIDAAGLARVDFFVHKETEEIWVNEINTMPGFTRISMYPKLWEASGLPYPQLIDRLIQLALERHARRARLETRPPLKASGPPEDHARLPDNG
ncbi:MAG: D-alanine--D-alanine ligase A [Firmicutes bacterium ZCTH02-B6]|nr:MAG: D-alanine--D-alanine ligase A [Firmicutes bacterium ZCTH02-B6]